MCRKFLILVAVGALIVLAASTSVSMTKSAIPGATALAEADIGTEMDQALVSAEESSKKTAITKATKAMQSEEAKIAEKALFVQKMMSQEESSMEAMLARGGSLKMKCPTAGASSCLVVIDVSNGEFGQSEVIQTLKLPITCILLSSEKALTIDGTAKTLKLLMTRTVA